MARHDRAPEVIDHRRPIIGHVLRDPAYDHKMLSRWEDRPWTFEHHHRELWRVLDGEMLWHRHQGDPLVGPGHDEARTGPGLGGGPDGGPTTFPILPTAGAGQPSGGPSVPEPSSGILMLAGLNAAAVARPGHRLRRPKDPA